MHEIQTHLSITPCCKRKDPMGWVAVCINTSCILMAILKAGRETLWQKMLNSIGWVILLHSDKDAHLAQEQLCTTPCHFKAGILAHQETAVGQQRKMVLNA